MSRVTSKLQVTIPKAIARRYGIEPGTEIDFLPAGEAIRVVPRAGESRRSDPARRLELFDAATLREDVRRDGRLERDQTTDPGWTREELYGRGVPD
jgi:AbrB family looped-hinge helix DNA binding protein